MVAFVRNGWVTSGLWVAEDQGDVEMEPLDWSSLRENCAGDESLVNEVLELFRREAEELMGDVRTAVTARDPQAIKRTAHRLKGALVSLAAKPCVEAARALEMAGAERELEGVDGAVAKLDSELLRLLKAISLPS
jgi:HPt (histidine-containing phosphotransfer) domain-containing protein